MYAKINVECLAEVQHMEGRNVLSKCCNSDPQGCAYSNTCSVQSIAFIIEKRVTLTCQTEVWLLHAVKSIEKKFLKVLLFNKCHLKKTFKINTLPVCTVVRPGVIVFKYRTISSLFFYVQVHAFNKM